MSVLFELNAEPRSDRGKGASRRLRRAGKIPAILYGGGQDPEALTLEHREMLYQLQNEGVYSHLLTLKIGSRSESVVLRDLQRHPFKPTVLHADFLRVAADRELRTTVPLRFLNEAIAHGVKQEGGVVSRTQIDIEISCLPKDLPEFIEVDLTALKLGDVIHLTDIVMPTGVVLAGHIEADSEHDAVVVSIHHAHSGSDDDEDKGEGDEAPEAPTEES